MSEALPDLESLRLLTLLGELGSLGRAAERLRISQPAASKRLGRLERQLRLPLAERGPRGTVLTTQGRALCQWSERVLAEADALMAGAGALRASRNNDLRLAASMTLAEHFLPPWIAALHRQSPQLRVTLKVTNSEQVAVLARQGRVEVGFVETPTVPPGLSSRVVGHDRLAVVVPPTHPWARRRRPLQLAELAATALIVREPGSGTRETLDRLLVKSGVHPQEPLMVLDTNAAVRSAVVSGVGPAVLSAITVGDDLALGRLIEIPIAGTDLGRTLKAVWRRGSRPEGPAAELLTLAARYQPTERARRSATT